MGRIQVQNFLLRGPHVDLNQHRTVTMLCMNPLDLLNLKVKLVNFLCIDTQPKGSISRYIQDAAYATSTLMN
jgi:hypothetical protein